jgi:hypothetical protein
MTGDLRPIANNESGDERIDQLLRAFRGIEPPPRPNDETVIEQLRGMPLRRWSRTTSFVERIRNMPLAVRLGMVACVVVAVVLFGVEWGAGNPAFAEVDDAISEQGAVRIQVEIDAQGPNMKQKEKRFIYASMPKPGAEAPKSLLEVLQLHFHVNAQIEVNREELDGQEVLVYKTEQPMLTNKSRIKETMWVDAKTKLPVKVQGEIVPTDPKMSQFFSRVVMSDFQWNPPDASKTKFFSTEPPSGFELKTIDLRSLEPKQQPDPASPSKE